MGRLKTLEDYVRTELMFCPMSRDDDRLLTLRIWYDYFGVNEWAPVGEVMLRRDLPSQESIGRVRRKVQAMDETLRGSTQKEKIRYNAQADYMDYANEV